MSGGFTTMSDVVEFYTREFPKRGGHYRWMTGV
jgi:hypothetical protein